MNDDGTEEAVYMTAKEIRAQLQYIERQRKQRTSVESVCDRATDAQSLLIVALTDENIELIEFILTKWTHDNKIDDNNQDAAEEYLMTLLRHNYEQHGLTEELMILVAKRVIELVKKGQFHPETPASGLRSALPLRAAATLGSQPAQFSTLSDGWQADGQETHSDTLRPPPDYVIGEADYGLGLLIIVSLPGLDGMAALDLSMNEDQLCLSTHGRHKLILRWPKAVDTRQATARFNKKSSELRLSLPYASSSALNSGDSQAATSAAVDDSPAEVQVEQAEELLLRAAASLRAARLDNQSERVVAARDAAARAMAVLDGASPGAPSSRTHKVQQSTPHRGSR